MKNWITAALLILIILTAYLYQNDIVFFVTKNLAGENVIDIPTSNEYKKTTSYLFVKNTDNLVPKNKEDLKNIYYTAINSGWSEVNYLCEKEYTTCIEDTTKISNDEVLLSHINNYVNPFNSFSEIKTLITNNYIVTLTIIRPYTKSYIDQINNKMTSIINSTITNNMTTRDKILMIHDYIINNAKYDANRISGNSQYQSHLAYGTLLEGHGICSGYSDSMSLFLDLFGIENYKISNDTHVWNLVKLEDGKWYHLDLTWDDPVTNTGANQLSHTHFLITQEELEGLNIEEHEFDKEIYKEALN